MNADGAGQTRLTVNPGADSAPAWSPDGTRIAFESDRDENVDLYVMNADGSGQTRLTTDAAYDGTPRGMGRPPMPSRRRRWCWFPAGVGLPTDTNRDGVFDDINGNGRGDFADVALYFGQLELDRSERASGRIRLQRERPDRLLRHRLALRPPLSGATLSSFFPLRRKAARLIGGQTPPRG